MQNTNKTELYRSQKDTLCLIYLFAYIGRIYYCYSINLLHYLDKINDLFIIQNALQLHTKHILLVFIKVP